MKKETNMTGGSYYTTLQATVINIMNKQAQLQAGAETLLCSIPSSLSPGRNDLCVGDVVEVGQLATDQYKLLRILPRKTAIYRGNRRSPGEDILIAANAQLLLVMVTASYFLNQAGYLESAMIAAKRAGIEIGIFVSKCDCVGENAHDLLQSKLELYASCVNFVFTGSACERQEELLQTVRGKTVLVIGDRSCGKTSLINESLKAQPENGSSYGKLPSTHTGILKYGFDETRWIDIPGFREFALQSVSAKERDDVFPEISRLSENCFFSNCTHVHEDGCEVLDALRQREIRRERYDAYQKMTAGKEAPAHTPKIDYKHSACLESFTCKVCGTPVAPDGAGSRHRNHCPKCLSSIHVDDEPGDRASLCKGIMEPVSVWVRKGGEWAIIHRCKACGTLSSNRIAADDNPALLMSIAVKPLAATPFPLGKLEELFQQQ